MVWYDDGWMVLQRYALSLSTASFWKNSISSNLKATRTQASESNKNQSNGYEDNNNDNSDECEKETDSSDANAAKDENTSDAQDHCNNNGKHTLCASLITQYRVVWADGTPLTFRSSNLPILIKIQHNTQYTIVLSKKKKKK